jgi:T5SS/PEP-CTERM-associated repeat protein
VNLRLNKETIMFKAYRLFVIVMSVVFIVSAAIAVPDEAKVWGGSSAVTGNWNTAANWEIYTLDPFFGEMTGTGTYAVPTASDIAQVWSGLVQVDSSVNATVTGIQTTGGSIEISGGSLAVSGAGGPEGYENFDLGRGLDVNSTLTISGGSLDLTTSRFNIAKSSDTTQGATAVLNQSGGSVNAGIVSVGEIAYDDASANGYTTPWPAMAGSGSYNLTGGTLTATSLNVGKGIDGTMTITAPGQLNGSAAIIVGAQQNATGQLDINGASVTAAYLRIGDETGATGSVTMDDASVNLSGRLYVGNGGGNGSLEISGTTLLDCERVYISEAANSEGSLVMSGGTLTTDMLLMGVGENSSAEAEFSGGSFATSVTSYMGQGAGSESIITVKGDAEFMPLELRMGWAADSVSTLIVEESGAVETGYIVAPENGTGAAIIKVIGSDPNRIELTSGRLQLRNSPNSELHFTFDNGGITPIEVLAEHAPLNDSGGGAPTIYLDITDDFDASMFTVGDSFDMITTTGAYTISISGADIVNNVAGYIDFDVAVVAGDNGGEVLRATITAIDNTCEGQIAAGNILTGDFNHDCIVNIDDLAEFVSSWLTCYDPQGCL